MVIELLKLTDEELSTGVSEKLFII